MRGGLVPLTLLALVAAHGQRPLFTSNQNAYFVHALTKLGFGFLHDDWLATMADPTPPFTVLAYWSLRLIGPVAIYLTYAVLVAVFAWAILGIARRIFGPWDDDAAAGFLLLTAVLGSGALGALTARAVGVDVTELLYWGFAGQFVLARYLQPSAFGVLFLVSVHTFCRGRWVWAVVLIGAGVTLHQSSVITGALLTAAFMLVAWRVDSAPRTALGIGVLSAVLVAPIVLYTLRAMDAGPYHAEALRILVTERNPLHAVVSAWIGWDDAVRAALLLIGWYLARRDRRLAWVLGVLIVGVVLLTGVQLVTGSQALALAFPWRPSTVAVPICASLLLAAAWTRILPWLRRAPRRAWSVTVVVVAAGLVLLGAGTYVRWWNEDHRRPERAVLDFVRETRVADARYVVPVRFAEGGFRVRTGVPILVDIKTVPISDAGVLEWKRRMSLVEAYYGAQGPSRCALGARLAEEGVTHVLFDRTPADGPCPTDEPVYQQDPFLVVRLGASTGP